MKKISFKEDVDPTDLFRLTKLAGILLVEVMEYCDRKGFSLTITSLILDRKNVKSKSTTHEDGRAFDIRTRDMMVDEAISMVNYFNYKFKNIAAISATSKQPICAVYIPGKDHIHFQVRRS